MKYYFLILAFFTLQAQAQNRFSTDTVLINIYNHQYNRNAAALVPYLKYPVERHRYHALMAFASVQDKAYAVYLFNALKSDASPIIRKAAAFSIGQLYDTGNCDALMSCFKNEKVTEVKNNILEALGKSADYRTAQFFSGIDLKNIDTAMHIGIARCAYHSNRRKRITMEAKVYLTGLMTATKNPEVKVLCQKVLNPSKPAAEIKKKPITYKALNDSFKKVGDDAYKRLAIMQRKDLPAADWYKVAKSTNMVPVQTYAMEQYLTLAKTVHDTIYASLLMSGNVAYVSLVCERIRKDSVWKSTPEAGLEILNNAMQNLVIPRDYEAWLDVYKTKMQLQKQSFTYPNFFESGYQNPIDWQYVVKIPEDKQVTITTNKGIIVLALKVSESPASVANFLKLVDSGYYNNKSFHRYVPDFVIQGGCPRGDGWGSLNWMQRSEFSSELRYHPGSVGLASAGKDSEGVQFFITHNYTTNLDGKYTIFAEVVKGMEVVNALRVGDRIISVQ